MSTTLVYINPLAARVAHKSPILNQLVQKLGRNYTVFRMIDPNCAPDALIKSGVAAREEFSHGASYAQLEQVHDEGTGIFINAMMEGLCYEPELWTDLIGMDKRPEWVAIHVGIPYELYAECAGEMAYDREIYETTELTTQAVVQVLNDNKKTTLH